MAITQYLAMTSAEIAAAPSLPPKLAWMACHFSPYSTGLSNIPDSLPEGSLLILNDRTPIGGHDRQRVLSELAQAMEALQCSGLLLDFQLPENGETAALTEYLVRHMNCPLGIAKDYAMPGAAVFLPPVPTDVPLKEYIAPWQGWNIWLETALEGQKIRLLPSGAVASPLRATPGSDCHRDENLHCRYRIEENGDEMDFFLYRTAEDLRQLQEEAEGLGIHTFIGLYQEVYEKG